MMNILQLQNIGKSYLGNRGNKKILDNINLSIGKDEMISIIGNSGSGKTTLLSIIAGLVTPSQGKVIWRGEKGFQECVGEGFVFQDYSLLPWLNVIENVLLAVDQTKGVWSKSQRREYAFSFVEKVGLQDAAKKMPSELSGGMQQRVSLARALSANPKILLLDEPLSALDALTRSRLQREIIQICTAEKKTMLLITNSVEEAIKMSNRILTLIPSPASTLGKEFTTTVLGNSMDSISLEDEITNYLKSKIGRPICKQ